MIFHLKPPPLTFLRYKANATESSQGKFTLFRRSNTYTKWNPLVVLAAYNALKSLSLSDESRLKPNLAHKLRISNESSIDPELLRSLRSVVLCDGSYLARARLLVFFGLSNESNINPALLRASKSLGHFNRSNTEPTVQNELERLNLSNESNIESALPHELERLSLFNKSSIASALFLALERISFPDGSNINHFQFVVNGSSYHPENAQTTCIRQFIFDGQGPDFRYVLPRQDWDKQNIQFMLVYTREECKKRLGLDLEIDTTQEGSYLDQWLEMQKTFSYYWSLH